MFQFNVKKPMVLALGMLFYVIFQASSVKGQVIFKADLSSSTVEQRSCVSQSTTINFSLEMRNNSASIGAKATPYVCDKDFTVDLKTSAFQLRYGESIKSAIMATVTGRESEVTCDKTGELYTMNGSFQLPDLVNYPSGTYTVYATIFVLDMVEGKTKVVTTQQSIVIGNASNFIPLTDMVINGNSAYRATKTIGQDYGVCATMNKLSSKDVGGWAEIGSQIGSSEATGSVYFTLNGSPLLTAFNPTSNGLSYVEYRKTSSTTTAVYIRNGVTNQLIGPIAGFQQLTRIRIEKNGNVITFFESVAGSTVISTATITGFTGDLTLGVFATNVNDGANNIVTSFGCENFLSTYNELMEVGTLTLQITPTATAVPPYKYQISNTPILEQQAQLDIINADLTGSDIISPASFILGDVNDTKFTFSNLKVGEYYVAAFDSKGVRQADARTLILPPLALYDNFAISSANNTLTTTDINGKASTNLIISDNTSNAEIRFQIRDSKSAQYFGLISVDKTLADKTSFTHGFAIANDKVDLFVNGVKTLLGKSITTSSILKVQQNLTSLDLIVDNVVVNSYPLPDSYTFRTGYLSEVKGTSLDLFPIFVLPSFVSLTSQTKRLMDCDGTTGQIAIKIQSIFWIVTLAPTFQITSATVNGLPITTFNGTYSSTQSSILNFSQAGVYVFYGRVQTSAGLKTFKYEVSMGYKTTWEESVRENYNLIPNTYSLKSTAEPLNGTGYSKAVSQNRLATNQTGWVSFSPVISNEFANQYFTLLSNSSSTEIPSPLNSQFNLRFVRRPASIASYVTTLLISWSTSNYSMTFPSNSPVLININANTIDVLVNGSILKSGIPRPTGTIFLKANSTKTNDGFLNVISSFPCETQQPLSQISFVELQRDLTAGYTFALEKKVKFTFDEEYQIETGKFLNYKLYDDNHQILASCTMEGIASNGAEQKPYQFDDNRYILNLANITGMVKDKYYLLEVETSTKEKRYLRILYKY